MYINKTNPNDPKRSKHKCHRWLPDLPLQKCDVPWLLLNTRNLIQGIRSTWVVVLTTQSSRNSTVKPPALGVPLGKSHCKPVSQPELQLQGYLCVSLLGCLGGALRGSSQSRHAAQREDAPRSISGGQYNLKFNR